MSRTTPMIQLVPLVLCLVSLWSALAQPFAPSCVQILRQTPDDFAQTYVQKTDDHSELGYDMAALYWAKCKAASNAKRLEREPQIKAKILRIRELERKLANAEVDLASRRTGNGPVYTHARTRAQATLELHVGRLIAIATSPTAAMTSRSIAREHQKALEQFEFRLKTLQSPNEIKARGLNRVTWLPAVNAYASVWSRLRPMLMQPTVFSLEVARFVSKGFFL